MRTRLGVVLLAGALVGGASPIDSPHMVGAAPAAAAAPKYAPSIVRAPAHQRAELVAVDLLGNRYVTDYAKDQVVEKITPEGDQSLISVPNFRSRSITTDTRGNLYVAEEGRLWVTIVRPDGSQVVRKFSGNEQGSPGPMVADRDGYVYLQDCDRNRLLKFKGTSGPVTSISTGLCSYNQIGIDSQRRFYYSDFENNRIIRFDPASGTRTVLPFTGLERPSSVAVSREGDVFVQGHGLVNGRYNYYVRVLRQDGTLATLDQTGAIGGGFYGLAVDAMGTVYIPADGRILSFPVGGKGTILRTTGVSGDVGLGSDKHGNVFVADSGNVRVIRIAPDGTETELPFSNLQYPRAVAVDNDGTVYVADSVANKIVSLTAGGVQATVAFVGLFEPRSVAVDSAGTLYVVNGDERYANTWLLKRTKAGVQSDLSNQLPSLFNQPASVAVDGSGNVFVSCSGFDADNSVIEIRKTGGTRRVFEGLYNGQGTAGLDVDAAGNVFVTGAGTYGSDISRIDPAGGVTTLPRVDPTNTYPLPQGLTVDSRGNVYVSDDRAGLIRFTPNQGMPAAPGGVASSVSGSTVRLSWKAPASNGSTITGYLISTFVGNRLIASQAVGASTLAKNLIGLDEGTNYRFAVAALTSSGAGPRSPATSASVVPFASPAAFVTRQYADVMGRAPSSTEILRNVEKLNYREPGSVIADLRLSADAASNVDPVARLYWAYFARVPDTGGLSYWIGKKRSGSTLARISDTFAASAEFKRRYGGLTNTEFVELVYQNVLGRTADSGGLSYWTKQLNTKAIGRGGVMIAFSESSENVRNKQADVDVVIAWINMLGRAPAVGELSSWIGALDARSATIADLYSTLLVDPQYRV